MLHGQPSSVLPHAQGYSVPRCGPLIPVSLGSSTVSAKRVRELTLTLCNPQDAPMDLLESMPTIEQVQVQGDPYWVSQAGRVYPC